MSKPGNSNKLLQEAEKLVQLLKKRALKEQKTGYSTDYQVEEKQLEKIRWLIDQAKIGYHPTA